MRWQARARAGVAVIGIACAVGVYATMNHRASTPATQRARPARIDPKALIESEGNVLQQVHGLRQDYVIEAAQQLTYAGGATRLIGVKITIRNRGGRDFVVSGKEAFAGERQEDLRLSGDVVVAVSDGFTVATDEASFTKSDGRVQSPGAFTFGRGRLSGSGTGMTYDTNAEVLSIAKDAAVTLVDEQAVPTTRINGQQVVFERQAHRLQLGSQAHVVRNMQVIDAGSAVAFLSDDDALVRRMELQGGASVSGGTSGLTSMASRELTLDYADDGATLRHALLVGDARADLPADAAGATRRIFGGQLDVALASDGSVTSLSGRDGVRLELPASATTTARRITSRTLEGTGQPGAGLTALRFRDDVDYREDAAGSSGKARAVKARTLQIALIESRISEAVFAGTVRFEEQGGLAATGGEVRYEPEAGKLRVERGQDSATPRVADNELTVEGGTIAVTIAGGGMTASGGVSTTLPPSRPTDGSKTWPALLDADKAAFVRAASLAYDGAGGKARYDGGATLVQGDTTISAEHLTLDQGNGTMLAETNARSTLVLDGDRSVGRGARIAYADADRKVIYEGSPAQVSGPQGDLTARRIEIQLAPAGGRADRLDAFNNVTLKLDSRSATGGRLTYFDADGRYVLTGTATAPVTVVDRCRRATGRTLTFFKSSDRIIVDGGEEIRTQTTGGGSCAAAPASTR